jgi:phosphate transport system substrate-binding protein
VEAPQWNSFAASLTNASGADSFPITSFSWVYVRASSNDVARMAAMRDLLDWIYSDGQQFAAEEGYSELPQPLLAAVKRKVQDLH